MIIDDYDWQCIQDKTQNTAVAIDFFLEVFADDLCVVSKDRQVLVQKLC